MNDCTFAVGSVVYQVDVEDRFSDNGAEIRFMPKDRTKLPYKKRDDEYAKFLIVPPRTWRNFLDTQYEGRFVQVLGQGNTVYHKRVK